eukprot:CAMPEP_0113650290 /NCGR_PEP_ID=MMETSP0017_2-20120614/26756_1 /TAXON_ID=2856 /ORGANISM="Cylindrotheca closterium" /LENGTH=151 /DNA_ID=CAMNT_0000562785 /DNA_START=249 /DNA_END=704 /DNA_ORIENTATION=- /assembly_acc=CAM_ASM_000147
MTATMNALYSPPDNPWSTASPSCNNKDQKACLSLSFLGQKDYGLWNSTPKQEKTSTEQSWGTTATVAPLDLSFLETPTEIDVPHDWSDDVSVLNDNPEEDDIEVLYLPTSTYNVLVPLFDALYIEDDTNAEHPDTTNNKENRQDQEASVAS